MKYWDLVFNPSWIVGLTGFTILISILIPINHGMNELPLGMLIGMIATMVAFGMAFNSLNTRNGNK